MGFKGGASTRHALRAGEWLARAEGPHRALKARVHREFGNRVALSLHGVAERWAGSRKREILDHVIVFTEDHLRRLVRDDVGRLRGAFPATSIHLPELVVIGPREFTYYPSYPPQKVSSGYALRVSRRQGRESQIDRFRGATRIMRVRSGRAQRVERSPNG